jgi:hypothetical protein
MFLNSSKTFVEVMKIYPQAMHKNFENDSPVIFEIIPQKTLKTRKGKGFEILSTKVTRS